MSLVLILTTASNLKEGKNIARCLIEQKAAACVNLAPSMLSVYRWKGRIENAKEMMLFIKTSMAKVRKVEKIILKLHSYEMPEMITLPIRQGNRKYLNWIRDSVRS